MTLNPKLDPSCVLCLPFEEPDGSIAYDISNYGNHGTIYGATRVNGRLRKALSFNGSTDYVEMLDSVSLDSPGVTDEVTILAWVKPFAFGERKVVFEKNSGYFLHADSSGYLWGGFYGSGGWREYTSTRLQLPVDSWSLAGMTYSRSSGIMTLHLDGQSDSNPIGSYDVTTGTISRIGCPAWAFIWFWNGLIDEPRVYSRALSAKEVYTHYIYGIQSIRRGPTPRFAKETRKKLWPSAVV
jgi:hypothetical protein